MSVSEYRRDGRFKHRLYLYVVSLNKTVYHQYVVSLSKTVYHQYVVSLSKTVYHQYVVSLSKTVYHQYVVSLSKTLNLHCLSRLSCEISTKRKHPREGCLFSAISYTEEIALRYQRFFIFNANVIIHICIFIPVL